MVKVSISIKELRKFLDATKGDTVELEIPDAIKLSGLSPSEALLGFIGWLTAREEKTIMSSTDDAAPVIERINEFCKEHSLEEPREGWAEMLHNPTGPQTPPFPHRSLLHKDCGGIVGCISRDEDGNYPDPLTTESVTVDSEVVVDLDSVCPVCNVHVHTVDEVYLAETEIVSEEIWHKVMQAAHELNKAGDKAGLN